MHSQLTPTSSTNRQTAGSRTKLQMPRAGPFIVVGAVGDKYSIQDLLTHKVIDTHVSNVIEFRSDSSEALSPLEVVARNCGFCRPKISLRKMLS